MTHIAFELLKEAPGFSLYKVTFNDKKVLTRTKLIDRNLLDICMEYMREHAYQSVSA